MYLIMNIPDELLNLILSNIEYTKIPKFKLVCRQFKRIIDSDYFESIHLDYKVIKLIDKKISHKYDDHVNRIKKIKYDYKCTKLKYILESCIRCHNNKLLKHLYKNQVGYNCINSHKILSFKYGNLEAFKYLCSIDENIHGDYMDKCMYEGLTNNNLHMTDYVINKLYPETIRILIFNMIRDNNFEKIKYLLDKNIIKRRETFEGIIRYAVSTGHYNIVKLVCNYLPN